MPSPRSSRLNLARYRERAGLRTPNESLAVKRCIWQWGLLSPEHRNPSTQGELAKALGVRRSYVWRILQRLPFDAPLEMLETSPITPAHVITMRRRQEQFRRQQEEQAQREAKIGPRHGARKRCVHSKLVIAPTRTTAMGPTHIQVQGAERRSCAALCRQATSPKTGSCAGGCSHG